MLRFSLGGGCGVVYRSQRLISPIAFRMAHAATAPPVTPGKSTRHGLDRSMSLMLSPLSNTSSPMFTSMNAM